MIIYKNVIIFSGPNLKCLNCRTIESIVYKLNIIICFILYILVGN